MSCRSYTRISIHAPSRERPSFCFTSFLFFNYFNPRSLAGATQIKLQYKLQYKYFNPRSLAGATLISLINIWLLTISIHAPSRERQPLNHFKLLAIAFQSTLPRGSDRIMSTLFLRFFEFQSTLPRGSDVFIMFSSLYSKNFNPRSLAGATSPLWSVYRLPFNFNPRSLAGATIFPYTLIIFCIDFNPRSLAGATKEICDKVGLYCISIHAPSRERPPYMHGYMHVCIFQSTLPRGSD